MTATNRLHLFEGYGVELEYMVVNEATLEVASVVDEVLKRADGGDAYVTDYESGVIGWGNELVTHVVEMRNVEPAPVLAGLEEHFQASQRELMQVLAGFGACLMPTGMHPWMNPAREARLWPHEYAEIYRQFDRVFDCRRHGWANLQSCQLNLSFDGDEEFGRLLAAIRLVMPLLPALAGSTPFREGRTRGWMCERLEAYRTNADRIPCVVGRCIPEPIVTRASYETDLLAAIYRAIEPHDPDGILQEEWLNARGAIARFERGAIELRVLDMQECAAADLAICRAVAGVVRALTEERWASRAQQLAVPTARLERVLLDAIVQGQAAEVDDGGYLARLGLPSASSCKMRKIWEWLIDRTSLGEDDADPVQERQIEKILQKGCLARRILRATGEDPDRDRLRGVYRELCACRARGEMFHD